MKIEIINDDVFIDGLVIVDPVVARKLEAVEAPTERASLLADMIEVGARVMQREQDGAAGDLLRREIERMQEQLALSQQALLDASLNGLGEVMRPVLATVSEHLATINGRLDGVLAVADREQQIAAERERGAAKGRPFEDAVAEAIDGFARIQGDTCEHVGDYTGIGGRTGDVVVGINGATGPEQGRIVFEAKTAKLSKPEAMRELDRARAERDSDFGVLVVAGSSKLPSQVLALREYAGDKLVVCYDPDDEKTLSALYVAYCLARARVLLSRGADAEIDTEAARHAIERALQVLDDARKVKLRLTSITTAVEETRDLFDDMLMRVRDQLSEVGRAITPLDS